MSPSDILVQVHIPKCAGTAVRIWLREAAVEGTIAGYRSLYPAFVFGRNEAWPSADDPRLTAASTHNIRRFEPTVAGRRVHYFTLLREPRSQALSALRYAQQERAAFGVPATLGAGTRDLAGWLLDGNYIVPFENAQTNHIALYTWCDASHGRLDPQQYRSWNAFDRAAYERERLDLAKELLASFLTVGTVERLPEALELLRQRSAPFGINLLPVDRLTRANVTDVREDDDITWVDNDPLGARWLESVAVDVELHAHVQQLLGSALDAANGCLG